MKKSSNQEETNENHTFHEKAREQQNTHQLKTNFKFLLLQTATRFLG